MCSLLSDEQQPSKLSNWNWLLFNYCALSPSAGAEAEHKSIKIDFFVGHGLSGNKTCSLKTKYLLPMISAPVTHTECCCSFVSSSVLKVTCGEIVEV